MASYTRMWVRNVWWAVEIHCGRWKWTCKMQREQTKAAERRQPLSSGLTKLPSPAESTFLSLLTKPQGPQYWYKKRHIRQLLDITFVSDLDNNYLKTTNSFTMFQKFVSLKQWGAEQSVAFVLCRIDCVHVIIYLRWTPVANTALWKRNTVTWQRGHINFTD